MRERGKRRKEERRQRISDKEKDNEEKGRGKEREDFSEEELLDNKHHTTTITFYLIRESDNQTQTELGCTISCAIKHVYIMYKLSGTCCVCCVTLFVLNSIVHVQTLQHPAFSRLQYRKGLKTRWLP